MTTSNTQPDFIFETSWEVCNKVGGIYTVLTTRAATMIEETGRERLLFVGPLLESNRKGELIEDANLTARYADEITRQIGLPVKVGYWDIPGRPLTILVDYKPLYEKKGELYFLMWEKYGIHGELGYGDYDDSCLFAIAAAKVMMAVKTIITELKHPVAIFNEWTTGMGLLYTKIYAPKIATIFITHATSTGRSIAGNGKPLYDQMAAYNGDQMAKELHVECKHYVEKSAAHHADAFCTVSDVTDVECRQLLDKAVDKVLPNGFEDDFVPNATQRLQLRHDGRQKLLSIARTLYARPISDDALIIATSGRSEYRNKGLDVYIDAMARLSRLQQDRHHDVIALILVPGWVKEIRHELLLGTRLDNDMTLPMQRPYVTHNLNDASYNAIQCHLAGLKELWGEGVYPIFIPAYLNGHDGIVDIKYYDLLPAIDLTLFPSYYEPWGYTPLESIAFGIPTATTDKSGFGVWASGVTDTSTLDHGVMVLQRQDYNFEEVAQEMADAIHQYCQTTPAQREQIAKECIALSQQAYWDHFYRSYTEAYTIALAHHHD